MTRTESLHTVASPHSMPSLEKLDSLGIDVDVTTLELWQDAEREAAKYQYSPEAQELVDAMMQWAKKLAQESMWRTAQQMARALLAEEE